MLSADRKIYVKSVFPRGVKNYIKTAVQIRRCLAQPVFVHDIHLATVRYMYELLLANCTS